MKTGGAVVTWGNSDFGGNCDAVMHEIAQEVTQVASSLAFAAVQTSGAEVMRAELAGVRAELAQEVKQAVHQIGARIAMLELRSAAAS